MKPFFTPNRSCSTLTIGATQLVVQDAFEITSCAAASWAATRSALEIQAQRTTYHQVSAVLLQAPVAQDAYEGTLGPLALARWTAPDGQTRTGYVTPPANATQGSTVRRGPRHRDPRGA
jgi:hypothetical protein